jgi:hypothetical protein
MLFNLPLTSQERLAAKLLAEPDENPTAGESLWASTAR